MDSNSFIVFFGMAALFVSCLLESVNCNHTRTEEEIIKMIANNVREENQSKLKGRSSFNRRKVLPADWHMSKYPNARLRCGEPISVPKKGFIRFVMNSKGKDCYYGFLGSKEQVCTASILCRGSIKFAAESPQGCIYEYMSIQDAGYGSISGCGLFNFNNLPRKPRKGTDMHLWFKGASLTTPCVAFCAEEFNPSHSSVGIKKPSKLPKNEYFSGINTTKECVCGKINDFGRVVGGTVAQKFEFPWLGFFAPNSQPKFGRNAFCGGALISDSHVISAAHCFVGLNIGPEELDFVLHAHVVNKRVGSENENYKSIPGWDLPPANDDEEGSLRLKFSEIINHPLFDKTTYDFDIAILKLKNKVDLSNKKIAPICLPSIDEIITYVQRQTMVVAGWGLPSENAPHNSRILQKLNVPYQEIPTCLQYTEPSYRHICAGYPEGGKDTCSGDSGGPLITMLDQRKNQYMLAGVVSAGVGCARRNKVGLYSDIRELMSWITFQVAPDNAKWCSR